MMKWLGLPLIVCGGGGIGFLYAMRFCGRNAPIWNGSVESLREIAVQIAFRSLTVQNCWNNFVVKPLV